MRVLVTGATGGIGEIVVEHLLKKGIEVVATSRDAEKASKMQHFTKITYQPYDIAERSNMDLFTYFKKPDTVIHLAWEKLNDYRNQEHLTTILDNHKHFVSNLFSNGLKDFNGVGTCYEYGVREGILSEDLPAAPVLPYPQGKNQLREFVEDQKSKFNISAKWIRIFYVFGEVKERKNLYTHLTSAIKNGDITFNMSGGEQIRDFLSPSEIGEIIVKVSLQKKVQGVINCCSGQPVKLKEFVQEFLKKKNSDLQLNLGFYPYLDFEPMESWGSVTKLEQALSENKFEK